MKLFRRRAPLILLAGALLGAGGALYAQLEGADRGVPPIDSSSTLEVTGIEVDASGKTSEEARLEGWRQAQRLGWAVEIDQRPQGDLTDRVTQLGVPVES